MFKVFYLLQNISSVMSFSIVIVPAVDDNFTDCHWLYSIELT